METDPNHFELRSSCITAKLGQNLTEEEREYTKEKFVNLLNALLKHLKNINIHSLNAQIICRIADGKEPLLSNAQNKLEKMFEIANNANERNRKKNIKRWKNILESEWPEETKTKIQRSLRE